MSNKNDIKSAIRSLARNDDEIYSILCTVSSVDLDNNTCDCVPINEAPDLLDVKLMPKDEDGEVKKGFLIVPVIGSVVVVTMLNNEDGHVTMFSEVEEIQLNGKNFKGIVKIEELVDKLNNLEDAFNNHISNYNNHITAYNTHTHAGVTVGGGMTGITTPDTPDTQNLTLTQVSDLENDTVLHGDGI
ncbi:MAG: hypothetical protein K0S53_406 [Bacteroidetes bacterium]|jgi:hypothetical protein|nr:hypothetical protein [Bacteroidota bacterium]